MKRALSLLLVLMLVLALFAGCSEEGKTGGGAATMAGVAGVYKIKSMNGRPFSDVIEEEMEGSGMTVDEYLSIIKEYYKIDSIEDMMTMTLKADGTCSASELNESMDGTWTLEGSKVTITIDGETKVGTYSNGTITFSDSETDSSGGVASVEYVFAKAG